MFRVLKSLFKPLTDSRRLRPKVRWAPRRQLRFEPLESRLALSVNFTPGALTVPAVNRTDTALGLIGGFVPPNPVIAINPTDPGNLAIASENGIRTTSNAGGTFAAAVAFTPPATANSFFQYGDLAFDSQGRLFWSLDYGVGTPGVSVDQISSTTGANISATLVDGGSSFFNFPVIAADQSFTSAFRDRLYAVWRNNTSGEIFLSSSTNQGATWTTPLQLSNTVAEGTVDPPDISVAPNGDVYVSYHSQPGSLFPTSGTQGQTFVLRSTDGGVTFGQKNLAFTAGLSDTSLNTQTDASGKLSQSRFWNLGSSQPWVLTDPARPGNIYVITTDDPDNNHGAGSDSDIVIARSIDNGQNWSSSTIASGPASTYRVLASAAIDQAGDIVLGWYDNSKLALNASNRYLLDVYATYSVDGGVTFATPFQVNDAAFDPDLGVVNYFNGPPATTDIGDHLAVAISGGTAYVAWNGNTAASEQVMMDSFPINGTLTITPSSLNSNDNIVIRALAGNAGYFEVLVNGTRQYAGLISALSGGISVQGGAGNETVTLDFSNGNFLPTGPFNFNGGAGNDKLIVNLGSVVSFPTFSFNGGSGTNTIQVTGNTNFNLNTSSLVLSGGIAGTVNLSNVTVASLTGGAAANNFTISSWNGTGSVNPGAGVATIIFGAGNLNALTGLWTVNAGSVNNTITFNDTTYASNSTYNLVPGTMQIDPATPRPFGGVTYAASVKSVTINGSLGVNKFIVTPSTTTSYIVNGSGPVAKGNYLGVNFLGTTGKNLNPAYNAVNGSGTWNFTSGHKPISFTNIKNLNGLGLFVTAGSTDYSPQGQPLVNAYDAETGLLKFQIMAYEPTFRGGVHVAVADMNGDGFDDIITAPGKGRAADIKVFDGRTGVQIGQTFTAYPNFTNGVNIAAGDLLGNNKNEIIVAPMRTAANVKVFTFNGTTGTLLSQFAAYPNTFIGGIVVAAGNVLGNGKAQIITAPQAGMASVIEVFDVNGQRLKQFLAFPTTYTSGVSLATGDVNGDGIAEILVGAGPGGASMVKVFNGNIGALLWSFQAFTDASNYAPVHVTAKPILGDGRLQIVVAQGQNGKNANARVFQYLNPTPLATVPISGSVLVNGLNIG